MKALYQRFFYVPEDGKVREQVLMARVTVTMVLIILYLLSMSLSAYAFYAAGDSNHNLIQTACFSGELTLIDASSGEPVENEDENGIWRVRLEPGYYTLQLAYGGSAETGFFVLRLNDSQYHTRQFFRENSDADEQVLMLYLYEQVQLEVVPHWGTSTCYDEFSRVGDLREDYLTTGETIQVGEPPEEPEPAEEEIEEPEPEEEPVEQDPEEEDPLTEEESTEPEEPTEVIDLTQSDPLE